MNGPRSIWDRGFRREALGFALMALLASSAAWAQSAPTPMDQARKHFSRGVELYRESDYRAAIIEFERAYKTSPNYKVLYNMGQAYLELQDYAAALDAFERFLSEGGDKISAEQRRVVQAEIDKLTGRVARAAITVDVPGATVLIDELIVGETPLSKPINLSTGRRKLTIRKEGYIPVSQRIDVAGGDNLELKFSLTPIASTQNEPVREPTPTPEPIVPAREEPEIDRGMGTSFWVSLTATGVFAAGAGFLGYKALSAKSDNDDQIDTAGVSKADLSDSKSDTERFALGTDILLGATLLAGGLTVYFALDNDDGSSTRVGIAPGGASVSGSF